MFKSAASLFLLTIASSFAVADDVGATKVGWSGTLSMLDGGLSGTVMVVDSTHLEIMNYVLKDASAPALYWWGATDDKLSSGFRISNHHVTETSDGSDLMIVLDAGKTTADFSVVGLWCERLAADFGQATLMDTGNSSTASSSASGSASATAASSAASATSSSSAATNLIGSYSGVLASLLAVTGLSIWIG